MKKSSAYHGMEDLSMMTNSVGNCCYIILYKAETAEQQQNKFYKPLKYITTNMRTHSQKYKLNLRNVAILKQNCGICMVL